MMDGTYLLATGKSAVQTLEKQYEIMAARSIEQLQKAGLKELLLGILVVVLER